MIPIGTELAHATKNRDGAVMLRQKVTQGPASVLDRAVTLILPSPREAVGLALKILSELVPCSVLGEHKVELERLVRFAQAAYMEQSDDPLS